MKLIHALRGFTTLLYFEFSVEELESGDYKLVMILAESEFKSAKVIRAEFLGVTNLCVKDFGGGMVQLLLLTIEDVRDKQLDRINYSISELEKDNISFMCRAVNFIETGPL